jgi:hypothetical protein
MGPIAYAVSVSGAVDEEQGIRNDGIKSSRSHRALEQWYSGGIQLIAGKAPTFSHFQLSVTETHVALHSTQFERSRISVLSQPETK